MVYNKHAYVRELGDDMLEIGCSKCGNLILSYGAGHNKLCRFCEEEYVKQQTRAKYVIGKAIKAGDLIYPQQCELCGKNGKMVAHHWNGHANIFDIWFLCTSCNLSLHGREFHLGQVTKAEARSIIMLSQFSRAVKEARCTRKSV